MWRTGIITKDWQGAIGEIVFFLIPYIMDLYVRGNDYGNFSFSSYFEALKFILKTLGSIPSDK